MLSSKITFYCWILFIFAVQSTLISQSETQPLMFQPQVNQNLLRVDSSLAASTANTVQCLSYSGLICTVCHTGYVLTNGKCFESIPNCLVQYTNVCTTCQPNYRPITSLLNSPNIIPSYVLTCVSESSTFPTINSTASTSNSSTSANPLILLGRESFITWMSVEVRYPTDIYLVMIWNFLDGNDETIYKIKISQNTLQAAVQGKVNDASDKLTLINWIIQNQLTNFAEGFIIDVSNLYFYRLRYKSHLTQAEYEVLVIIHEISFQITLLQQLLVKDGSNGTVLVGNSTLAQSEELKGVRQQVLDLKMQASQQRQLFKQRQMQFLIFSQFSLLSTQTIQTDPGCIIIKAYLDNKFNDFIKLLNIDSGLSGVYSWMNFELKNVYFRKTDSINKDYLYEIGFTDDVTVLVQFTLGRLYDILDLKVVYNR